MNETLLNQLCQRLLEIEQLNDTDELVLRLSLQGKTYQEIADESSYDDDYIRDVGCRLWRKLSQQIGIKVTKKNICSVVQRYFERQSETKFTQNVFLLDRNNKICNVDWGEAIDINLFFGREQEIQQLQNWIRRDCCRLITICGMGGIGKTALVTKLAKQIKREFEYIVWHSLRNAPTFSEVVSESILFLSQQQEVNIPNTLDGQINCLIKYLRVSRCLLILDNVESILSSGTRAGYYREDYEDYGQLLRRIADENHQSCLIITSREKIADLEIRDGKISSVKFLQLQGLTVDAAKAILRNRGIPESQALIKQYVGNPLALKIAATTIKSIFAGNVGEFMVHDSIIYGDIEDLLNQQFNRLSDLEKVVMYWLAINREWQTLSELEQDIFPRVSSCQLLATLESLKRRSLIEVSISGFTQQTVVMEYITQKILEIVCQEIINQNINWLRNHYILKAQNKDYLRTAQIRCLLDLIVKRLIERLGDVSSLENQLERLLERIRWKPAIEVGYAGGNIINLLAYLQVNLNNRDFSGLILWQAYLPKVTLHQVNLTGTDVSKSMFAQAYGDIATVTFSPNGKHFATADTVGRIQLWDVYTGQQILSYKGHAFWIWSLAFSPDGKLLASVGEDYLVKIWDISSGECLKILRDHTFSIVGVAFSPDGTILASCGQDKTIRLWDIQNLIKGIKAEVISCRILTGHAERVWSIAFSPIESVIASGAEDKSIKIWCLNTGKCIQTLESNGRWVKSIAYSPDGQLLASGNFNKTIELWDVKEGKCIKILSGHLDAVTTICFSSDGKFLASSSYDKTIRLWNIKRGECIKTFQGHTSRIWSVAFNPNCQLIASGGDNQIIKLWNIKTGKCTQTSQGYTNATLHIDLDRDAKYLASGHEDCIVRLWDFKSGRCHKNFEGHQDRVWSVAFAKSNNLSSQILASGSADRTIKLWDLNSDHCLKTLRGHGSWVHHISFSNDDKFLISSSYDKTIKLWDISAGICLKTFAGHQAPVHCVQFSQV